MLKRKTLFSGLLFAGLLPAATFAVALAVAPAPASASSNTACEHGWLRSSARASCVLDGALTWNSSLNKCSIKTRCKRAAITPGERSTRVTHLYVTVTEAKQLNNCDGHLVVGNC